MNNMHKICFKLPDRYFYLDVRSFNSILRMIRNVLVFYRYKLRDESFVINVSLQIRKERKNGETEFL